MTVVRSGIGAVIAAGVLAVSAQFAWSAEEKLPDKISGDEIKAKWFDGKPFTATSPDGVGFVMTFNADGKSTRKPVEKKKGITGATGFWRVIAEGYCSRWNGQNREKCFNVRPDPASDGSVVVRFGTQVVASWKR